MKKIALAAAFAGVASTAFAGNTTPPVIETEIPDIIDQTTEASSSGAGLAIPLIILALVVAAVAD